MKGVTPKGAIIRGRLILNHRAGRPSLNGGKGREQGTDNLTGRRGSEIPVHREKSTVTGKLLTEAAEARRGEGGYSFTKS